MGEAVNVGDKVYIATDRRYVGGGKIESKESDGNLIVKLNNGKRGRVAPDQVFSSVKDAKANVKGQLGGWSDVGKLVSHRWGT